MDSAAYLDFVTSGGRAMAAAADGNLAIPVPSCPEWSMAGLVGHLGGVYGWVIDILRAPVDSRRAPEHATAPAVQDQLLPWFVAVHQELVAELGSHSPDDPAWVFVSSAPQNAGWWYRRQALETAVHRWDAEAAAGGAAAAMPLDPELAADGVDEFTMLMLPRVLARNPVAGLKGTFHMHATDAEGEWMLDLDAADLAARREHGKADTALRGPASGLNLWLGNRQSPEEAGLEVFGDLSVVAAFDQVRF